MPGSWFLFRVLVALRFLCCFVLISIDQVGIRILFLFDAAMLLPAVITAQDLVGFGAYPFCFWFWPLRFCLGLFWFVCGAPYGCTSHWMMCIADRLHRQWLRSAAKELIKALPRTVPFWRLRQCSSNCLNAFLSSKSLEAAIPARHKATSDMDGPQFTESVKKRRVERTYSK